MAVNNLSSFALDPLLWVMFEMAWFVHVAQFLLHRGDVLRTILSTCSESSELDVGLHNFVGAWIIRLDTKRIHLYQV